MLSISTARKSFLCWCLVEPCYTCDVARGHTSVSVETGLKLKVGFQEKQAADSHKSMSKII